MWASIETTKPNRNCVNLNTCTHNYVISDEAGTIYWLCCGGEQQTRGRPLPLVLLSNGGLARRALALPHTHAQNMHTQSAHSKTKCTHCTDIHTNVCMHPDSQRLEHFLLSLGTVLSQTVKEMLTLPHQTAWLWELQAMPIFNHLMPV